MVGAPNRNPETRKSSQISIRTLLPGIARCKMGTDGWLFGLKLYGGNEGLACATVEGCRTLRETFERLFYDSVPNASIGNAHLLFIV